MAWGGMYVSSCNHDYCTVPEPAAVDLSFSVGGRVEDEIKKTEEAVGALFQTVAFFFLLLSLNAH